MLIINSIFAIALILAYLSTYISPDKVFWLPFFGLAYSYILFLNILFVVFWAFNKRSVFLLSLIIIIVGYGKITNVLAFNVSKNDQLSRNTPIKVLSYNVRIFDLYNWSHKTKTRDKIFDYISHQNADVICFQEFFNDKSNKFNALDGLIKSQKAREVHTEYTSIKRGVYQFGIATFSKYPIVKRGVIRFDNTSNITIFTDIKIKNDTIRVYNNHLQSNHFTSNDYELIDNLSNTKSTKYFLELSNVISKLSKAFIKRAYQVEKISKHIKQSPYPVIVCGDFNDVPTSYTYTKMRGHLDDAFIESGFGFGTTTAMKFPSFRIDYIFHDKNIKSSNFVTDKVYYSDHFPVHCLLYLPEK